MGTRVVKISVVGDAGVGKTSLISTAANDTFDVRPAPVLPPTRLPAEFTPDHVPMVVTDTSSRPEDQQVTDLVLQTSDVVVVCFDATRQATLDSIRAHWYSRIQGLNPGVPVIMACCKADRLNEEREVNMLRERVERAVHDLSHVEVCLNCSAKTLRMVADVFFYALKSVLYPLQPLYDRLEKRLRPLCVRALKRVFVMCDADGDGVLNDVELNAFQLACFGMALDESELQNVKQIVSSKMPSGVSSRGITLEGFLFLHVLFIERGRLESTWAVLRKFGYNDSVVLSDDVLSRVNFNPAPDHVWELSDVALDFLVRQFRAVDDDHDGLLSWQQLDALFSTIPPPVWQGEPWSHLLVPGMYGLAHKLEAFLLKWQLHVMVDARAAYAHLLYLGYGGPDGSGGPALLAKGVRRKSEKRYRNDLAARTTLQCLVFGPRSSGKTSVLRALVGQRPEGPPTTTTSSSAPSTRPAKPTTDTTQPGSSPGGLIEVLSGEEEEAGVEALGPVGSAMAEVAGALQPSETNWTSLALVKGPDDRERTLILHEVGEELEAHMLTAAALAAHGAGPLLVPAGTPAMELGRADVAAFMFDSSNPASFRAAADLLVKVSTLAGDTLPCVLVATKDELVMSGALENQVASTLSELQLKGLVRVSAETGDLGHLFPTLVGAAINPEGWIPETPARKAHRRFVRQAVTGVVVGTVTAGVIYCTYRLMSSSSTTSTTSSTAATSSSSTSSGASSSVPFFGGGGSSGLGYTGAVLAATSHAGSGEAGKEEWSVTAWLANLMESASSMWDSLWEPPVKGSTVKAHSTAEATRSRLWQRFGRSGSGSDAAEYGRPASSSAGVPAGLGEQQGSESEQQVSGGARLGISAALTIAAAQLAAGYLISDV